MKTRSVFIVMILSLMLVSACSANAAPAEAAALDNIFTAAASTLSLQETVPTPTPTATMFVTPTLFSLPTAVPATMAYQDAVSSSSSASTASGCNNAAYVSDVTITDGTVLAPGESFTKTWEFENTGTCAWNVDYQITFVSGTDMDGETTGIDQDVETGAAADISVSLIAPSNEGSYTGYWRLTDEDGNLFGQSVYVMIVVSDDASTSTPTATTEPTSTPTTYP
jgi:hypothetical protein